ADGAAALDPAVAVALSVAHLLPRGGAPRCRHDRRVLVWCIPFMSHLTAPAFPAASAGPGSRRSPRIGPARPKQQGVDLSGAGGIGADGRRSTGVRAWQWCAAKPPRRHLLSGAV